MNRLRQENNQQSLESDEIAQLSGQLQELQVLCEKTRHESWEKDNLVAEMKDKLDARGQNDRQVFLAVIHRCCGGC